jgi:two-component system, cell cycle response regulator
MDRKRTMLIVDDNEAIIESLKAWLDNNGYISKTASDATQAMAIIEQQAFDFMLTDIVLPEVSGLVLTEKVKALQPNTKIVVMTGYGDSFTYDKAIEAGASDYIKKPFTMQELSARMKILQMQEDVLNWAITDELTGIYNRKGFYTLASHLLKVAKRNKQGMFLLYADLDDLKEINDTYGHKEGDLLISETAKLLTKSYRKSDVIARIGGDEFVVFPVGTSGDSAEIISDRLEKAIANYNEQNRENHKISLSWGIALFRPESPHSVDALLEEADTAMYGIKKGKKAK